MDGLRRPLQGVSNILRFNWHYYAFALVFAAVCIAILPRAVGLGVAIVTLGINLISLLVSWYVYDASGLYRLAWLDGVEIGLGGQMVNIHAGFDETTPLLRARYPEADWVVLDFYDPEKHTEVSIKRARRAYPPSDEDLRVSTSKLPLPDGSVDAVFVLLAAHEIRAEPERTAFFEELRRLLGRGGKIILLEHLRNGANGLAYTVGAFHFIAEKAWRAAFHHAGLRIARRFNPNPFITCFVLEKDEAAA